MSERTCHTSPALGEAYEQIIHKSGLRVLVCHKDMSATYAMLGVNYGSADMPEHLSRGLPTGEKTPLGLAHFLEHKMFEAEDGTSVDLTFAELGAEVNAYTSYDRTVYYVSCTQCFSEALTALLSLVKQLCISQASVRREATIISEEIRMNDDSPFERCYAELLRAMYHSHRVREEICGTEASISRITPKLLKAHFDAFYRPDNMVLSVAGNVTAEEVMTLVDACFDHMALPFPMPQKLTAQEPAHPLKPYTELRMQVSKPLFCIGVKDQHVSTTPREIFRRDLCMTVLSEMLFSRSGAFYSRLFESEMITPTYSYGSSIGQGYGYFAISGEGDHPHRVYEAFCDYIASVKAQGLSQEDFERSRRILYADYVTGFDATEDIAQSLLTYAMDGIDLFDFIPTVTSMTLSEVSDLFYESFSPDQFVLSVVWPLEDIEEHPLTDIS